MGEQKNLFLAIGLALVVLTIYQYLVVEPAAKARKLARQTEQVQVQQDQKAQDPAIQLAAQVGRQALTASQKIQIDSPSLDGSITAYGSRFNQLSLKAYREELDPDSPEVRLLDPKLARGGEFAMFGWRAADEGANNTLPGLETSWQVTSRNILAPGAPVTMTYESDEGLVFTRRIEIDQQYMFSIFDTVTNTGNTTRSIRPFGQVRKYGDPTVLPKNATPLEKRKLRGSFVSHQGVIGANDGEQIKYNYKKIRKGGGSQSGVGGWIGFTSKYWLTAVIAPLDEPLETNNRMFRSSAGVDVFEASFLGAIRQSTPGSVLSIKMQLFSGAKEVKVLQDYQDNQNIARFDTAIDWGLFWFLTRPYFIVLDWLYGIVGNFGLAIMALTVIIKAIFFPLANKSYESMARMKALQPKMEELKEKFKDDAQQMQKETMALYQREKVSPFGGCLPILLQIPVFFALYKTLYISLEMRHAPFFGWIQDLSEPDPTAIGNLFGLIPWDPTTIPFIGAILAVGIWPLLMGLTMGAQQLLNPPAPDPMQRKIFAFMPVIFTIMMAPFAAGLVIYWSWNNFLSLIQQYIITRKNGVETPFDKWIQKIKN
ncbi:Inner membrane protein translocase and chaperone YidC, long form [hydrothermal vent metagenome]|uniref:Membrane protein insertase YidC n=1 Tax=hydrothermal vent metagenome TaxID=652676 RepID=A0A3B0SD75_9ZZZZ